MRFQQLIGLVMATAGLGIEIWLAILINSGDGAQNLLIHIGAPWTLILSAIGVLGLAAGAALFVAPSHSESPSPHAARRRDRSFRSF